MIKRIIKLLNAVIILILVFILLAFTAAGCGKVEVSETAGNSNLPGKDTTAQESAQNTQPAEPETSETVLSETVPSETIPSTDIKPVSEEDFILNFIDAINNMDYSFLVTNYDSIYGETVNHEIEALPKGLELYSECFRGENLVGFEFVKEMTDSSYDTPETVGMVYRVISESGIKRELLIKKYGENIYKFDDPLLFYGDFADRKAKEYFKNVSEGSVAYIYDYYASLFEDTGGVPPYDSADRNEELAAYAEALIANYRKAFDLDSLKLEFTGRVSGAVNSYIDMEYLISGTSPGGKPAEHIILAVYEFPVSGVYDSFSDSGWRRSELPVGFAYLDSYIENIAVDLRYFSDNNFVGRPVAGYESNKCIVAFETVIALQKAEAILNEMGLGLVVFDAYRPQRAVDDFVAWAGDAGDTLMKEQYYPDIDKKDIIPSGFLAVKSAHSRGCTIDVSIIRFDDGSPVDMGGNFDFFGDISRYDAKGLSEEQRQNRALLRSTMEKCGFKYYYKEWWHYSLTGEPFPDTYFDFAVK